MPNETTPSKPAVKTPTKKPSNGRVVKWTQRILGRTIGITFIVGGIVTGLVLANELEDQPRTEDAYVRANVILSLIHI